MQAPEGPQGQIKLLGRGRQGRRPRLLQPLGRRDQIALSHPVISQCFSDVRFQRRPAAGARFRTRFLQVIRHLIESTDADPQTGLRHRHLRPQVQPPGLQRLGGQGIERAQSGGTVIAADGLGQPRLKTIRLHGMQTRADAQRQHHRSDHPRTNGQHLC